MPTTTTWRFPSLGRVVRHARISDRIFGWSSGRIAGALGVAVCVAFVGRAAGHVIDAQLGELTLGLPLPRASVSPQAPPVPEARGVRAAPGAFVDRNVFCADCPPPGAGDPPLSPGEVAATRLPIVLVATSLDAAPARSTATLRNTASGGEGAFRVGQRVPGAGPLEKVAGTYVLVKNEQTGAIERVELASAASPEVEAPPPQRTTPTGRAEPPAPWAGRVRALDERTFEVERALIRELVASQGRGAGQGARLAPATRDGKLAGVRVQMARKDSLATALGLRVGDVIEAVDGAALDSPDALLGLYAQLDRASAVQLRVARGGQPVTLDYRLR